MARLTINPADMMRGMPVPEKWYKARLVAFEEQVNSKKDGINYVPTFEFTDDKEITRKIQTWFSNKSLSMQFAQFVSAVTDKKLDPTVELDVDTDDLKALANHNKGTELWIHVAQDFFQGRVINKVDNYLSASEEVPF